MEKHLVAFIEAHPDGWDHQDWLGLLAELEADGVDVNDTQAIGRELERQRLAWELRRQNVRGLGPRRIEALVDRFGTLYALRRAGADEIAEIKTIHAGLAEDVVEALR